jgi:hypothetical protein
MLQLTAGAVLNEKIILSLEGVYPITSERDVKMFWFPVKSA